MDIQIITPPVADETEPLEHGLIALTRAIEQINPDKVAHGCLGGTHGYGGEWENEVFMMHPFCWCDSEDCPWCMGCDCPDSAYHYLIDGKEVSYEEWMAFFERETGDKTQDHDVWIKKAEAANLRRATKHDAVCDYCSKGRHPERGATPGQSAPNFWHKKTGLKVRWYKWIGRGMEIENGAGVDLQSVFSECLSSIKR